MIRLRQTKGADSGREFEFVMARVRIGRVPDSEVNFDPEEDLDASGRHAEIRRERGGYWIVDTDSRNGTWLNGERIKRVQLRAGDELEFGRGGPRLVVVELTERSMVPRARTEPSFSMQASAPSEPDPFSVPVTVTTRLEHLTGALASSSPSSADLGGIGRASVPFSGPEDDTLPPPPPPLNPGSAQIKRRRSTWLGVGAAVGLALVLGAVMLNAPELERSKRESAPVAQAPAADDLRPAVRQVVGEDAEGVRSTPCLAFAVMERLYATTASCVALIQRGQARGLRYVVQAGSGDVAEVRRMWRHPDYLSNMRSANVGLLEVSEASEVHVDLASAVSSEAPEPGDPVLLFDGAEPSVSATIARVDRLEGDSSAGAGLLLHGAAASDGSPIVGANGTVLGIHVAPHGSVEGYGVRADRIEGLVRGLQLTARQADVSR